jgi:hypothetical protein
MLPLAQAGLAGSFVTWAVVVVVVLAVVALVYLAAKQMGVPIPPFVVQVFWILFAAVIVIAAILFLARVARIA